MSIELPRDAEGREIPLDTDVLYSQDGRGHRVVKWEFHPHSAVGWLVWLDLKSIKECRNSKNLYLTPPDSWEKLEEDLDRCIEADCISYGTSLVLEDIKQRIRKLAEKES